MDPGRARARDNCAPSTIASIETGALKPQAKSAKVFDQVFDLPGTFERIEEMMSGSVYPASFAPFTEYEAEAKTLRTWQHSLIPGLLQTRGVRPRGPGPSRTRARTRLTGW